MPVYVAKVKGSTIGRVAVSTLDPPGKDAVRDRLSKLNMTLDDNGTVTADTKPKSVGLVREQLKTVRRVTGAKDTDQLTIEFDEQKGGRRRKTKKASRRRRTTRRR